VAFSSRSWRRCWLRRRSRCGGTNRAGRRDGRVDRAPAGLVRTS
jgi:hypothetical protein